MGKMDRHMSARLATYILLADKGGGMACPSLSKQWDIGMCPVPVVGNSCMEIG